MFFLSSPLTRQWVFYWIADSSQVITPGESGGEHATAKCRRNLNSDALLTILLDILRTEFYNLEDTLGFLKCNYKKNSETTC